MLLACITNVLKNMHGVMKLNDYSNPTVWCTCLCKSFILLVWFKFKCFKCLYVINMLPVKRFVRKFSFSRVALNDTKTRLSLMTRHGSYWNNIIIARVATSFFRVNLRQGRHRIRLYIIIWLFIWVLVWHISKKDYLL